MSFSAFRPLSFCSCFHSCCRRMDERKRPNSTKRPPPRQRGQQPAGAGRAHCPAPEGLGPNKLAWLGLRDCTRRTGTPTGRTRRLRPAHRTALGAAPGMDAGEVAWPVPRLFRIGRLANYGYDGEVLLVAPLKMPRNCRPPLAVWASVRIGLHATWLACRVECIPKKVGWCWTSAHPGHHRHACAAFAQAQAPARAAAGQQPSARGRRTPANSACKACRGCADRSWRCFPKPCRSGSRRRRGGTGPRPGTGNTWTASLPLSPERGKAPLTALVLAPASQSDRRRATRPAGLAHRGALSRALGRVRHRSPACRPHWPAGLRPTQAQAPWPLAAPAGGRWFALLGACSGHAAQPHALRVPGAGHQGHGLCPPRQPPAPTTDGWPGLHRWRGAVLSGAGRLLLMPARGGRATGLGLSLLQSPAVVAALAGLFTLIGLNLAGLFEFGQFAQQRGHAAGAPPMADAFLTGVLAVAIASPCTAPSWARRWVCRGPARRRWLCLHLGLGMALPLPAGQPGCLRWRAGCRAPAPGWTRSAAPWPSHVCHGGVAGWVLGQQSGIDARARCWRCWWQAAWCGR